MNAVRTVPSLRLSRADRREPWSSLRDRMRERGLRWTPQRRVLIDVLSKTSGHVTVSELIERCREIDPATIPSTVYRTLVVLEQLGIVSHSHRADGREEFHVLPDEEHGHLYCDGCGGRWEIDAQEARPISLQLQKTRRFQLNLSHLTIVGRCAACANGTKPGPVDPASGTL